MIVVRSAVGIEGKMLTTRWTSVRHTSQQVLRPNALEQHFSAAPTRPKCLCLYRPHNAADAERTAPRSTGQEGDGSSEARSEEPALEAAVARETRERMAEPSAHAKDHRLQTMVAHRRLPSSLLLGLCILSLLKKTAATPGVHRLGGRQAQLVEDGSTETLCQGEDFEPLTNPDWTINTQNLDLERHGWWYSRQPFQPIVGDVNLIAGVLYSYSREVFKMTVIFPPLHPVESRSCQVVIKPHQSNYSGRAYYSQCTIKEHTWHCTMRIDRLPSDDDYDFQVMYRPDESWQDLVYTYGGSIRAPRGFPRIAAMGCFGPDTTYRKDKLVYAALQEGADLLVLQGDQTYSRSTLSYGFIELIYSINELTRRVPTIVQMDDHDYGEPNLWGAWNGDEESGSGFFKPVCLVNALQQQSMGHNPDPATQMTLANGITVHYTSYEYGMVEFAVLEARKFKNHRGNSLLGDEQESWLRGWCSVNDEKLKIILSQTPFASLATNVTTFSSKPPFVRAVKAGSTFDTNGYPAEGRRRFMEIIQGCSPLILSGDQHLGIAVTYDDYDVMECASPAVSNDVFWRISVGKLNSTYIDGFGHSYRLLNVWNVHPDLLPKQTPYGTRFKGDVVKAKRGDGYLVVDLDGTKATCKMKGYRNGPSLIWSADAQAKFRRDDATA